MTLSLRNILEQQYWPKNKWVDLSNPIKKDSNLRLSLVDLVKNVYDKIGGHNYRGWFYD